MNALSITDNRWHEEVRRIQARVLTQYLRKNRGHCGATARELGIHRNTLTRQMEYLGIDLMAIRHGSVPKKPCARAVIPTPVQQSYDAIRSENEPQLQELIHERGDELPPEKPKQPSRIDRMMHLAEARRPKKLA